MEEQLEQSKRRLHFCMALIGGWFGAYAICLLYTSDAADEL